MKQIILHDDSFEIEIDVLDSLTTSLPVTVHYYESLSDNVAEKLLLFHLTQGSNTIISGSPNHPIVITEITIYNTNDSGKDIVLKITDGVDSFAVLKEKIKAKETFYLSCCKGMGGGGAGQDGVGLDYDWDGTELGVKREDEDNYTYTDLKGEKGDTGEDGDEIALRVDSGYIQWRVDDGVDTWKNLIALSALKGADGQDGRKVELQADSGYIQWKYDNVPTWTNLIAISDLKGAKGDAGDNVELQVASGYIQWRVADGVDIWKNLLAVSTLKGDAGESIELNVSDGYIKWRVADGVDTWKNLVKVSDLKGDKGDTGDNGIDGTVITTGSNMPSGGVANDLYIRTSNYDLYKKVGSNWTVIGNIKGATGEQGKSIYSSVFTAPSNIDGNDGDLHIVTSTGAFYKKSSGTWTMVGNLRGPAGSGIQTGNGSPSGGNDGDLYIDLTTYDLYEKISGTWTVVGNIKGGSGGGGVEEAPNDGKTYGRKEEDWEELDFLTETGLVKNARRFEAGQSNKPHEVEISGGAGEIDLRDGNKFFLTKEGDGTLTEPIKLDIINSDNYTQSIEIYVEECAGYSVNIFGAKEFNVPEDWFGSLLISVSIWQIDVINSGVNIFAVYNIAEP